MGKPKNGIFLVIAVIAATFASPASASESAADFIQPRMDRQRFAAFLAPLELDKDQQMIAELLMSDYVVALTELTVETDHAADAAGRRRITDAFSGRRRVSPEELRELRAAVLGSYRDAWPQCDAQLETLLDGVVGVLTDAQVPTARRAIVALRRDLWLESWRDADGMPEYAGEGVDLFQLATAARARGGELAAMPAAELDRLLDEYVHRLDELLREVATATRSGSLAQRVARIRRDAEAERREEAAAIARWRRLFDLNLEVVNGIAAGLDEADSNRWRRRFDEASFPWLVRDDRPSRIFAWMQSNLTATETLTRAGEIIVTYQERREALLRQAIGLIVQGRLRLNRVMHPALSPVDFSDSAARELQEKMLRNSGARSSLSDTTESSLRELLSKDERKAMSRALRSARR